jgi:hypothetical protein
MRRGVGVHDAGPKFLHGLQFASISVNEADEVGPET